MSLIVVLHWRAYQIESCSSPSEKAMNAVVPTTRNTDR